MSYMTSILMVTASACFVYYKSSNNNYTYMKMYVFHLPLLFVIFWGSLHIAFEKHVTKLFNLDLKWLYLSVAMPIVISGMVYIIIAGIFLLTNKMGGRSHTENPEKEENSKDMT